MELSATFGLIDRKTIPQAILNIENKTRTNPFTWNGQFSPQLIEVLLNHYAQQNSVVLDPFMGSGTTLLEAGRKELVAVGIDINPSAYLLACNYLLINMPHSQRKHELAQITENLNQQFQIPLLNYMQWQNERYIKSTLITLSQTTPNQVECLILKTLILLLDAQIHLTTEKAFTIWGKLVNHIIEMPYSNKPIKIYQADSRNMPITHQSVDLIITSPPYINVFNYHQNYRASIEALGYNILEIAKTEIGSNRKNRSNRFLTIVQYCLDMTMVFNELLRVSKLDTRIILIVGRESKVLGVAISNSQLIAQIAQSIFNLPLLTHQERWFTNRFGQVIYEDILHFSPQPVLYNSLAKARFIAESILRDLYDVASTNTKQNIRRALEKIETVQPSPLYKGFYDDI